MTSSKQAKNPRVARSKDDLKVELKNQISLLQESCGAYDRGLHAAGKHIALSLRVLLHREGALLEQLGLRSGRFYDTSGPINPKNLLATCTLAGLRVESGTASYAPLVTLGMGPALPKKIPFADWWNQTVIVDNKRRHINRRELVLNVADTDGGAHVDPTLDEVYMDLSRNNSLNVTFRVGDIEQQLPGPELACMRQIAHEVLLTLKTCAPDSFSEAPNVSTIGGATPRRQPAWTPFMKVDASEFVPPASPFATIGYKLWSDDEAIPLMIRFARDQNSAAVSEVSGPSGVLGQRIADGAFYVSLSHPSIQYEISVLGYEVDNGDR